MKSSYYIYESLNQTKSLNAIYTEPPSGIIIPTLQLNELPT